MSSAGAAISVRGLAKRYGDVEAVRGIDFEVAPGETFGFLGPNGAGKSTTIHMLCKLARPTAGSASVAGFDVVSERLAVRRSIGLVFQDTTLDSYLTAAENLRFHAELYGLPRAGLSQRIAEVLDLVGLADRAGALVLTFSGGMKRRLEIARGLLHAPRVLFLDEPTIGLDPQTRSSIWEYLAALRERESMTIFLTTHYMDEAEHCDRIAIIDEGVIVTTGSPTELKAGVGADRVAFSTSEPELAIAALRERFDVEGSLHEGEVICHVAAGDRFVPRLFAELGVEIESVSVARPSLDDVFMSWTGRTIRDAEADAVDRNRAFARAFRGRR
ncbi:MAG TPA: ATP-binding cassette domain-containing protein [Gaiellaceae bacterium]|nr:ATP-binding cassette domain-containing protein [Gaiellaceae bacterium]